MAEERDDLDALAKQDWGYTATLTLKEGPANALGAFEGTPDQDVTITLQADFSKSGLFNLIQGFDHPLAHQPV